LPADADFADELITRHSQEYPEETFACLRENAAVTFPVLRAESGPPLPRILPGSALAPLNKLVSTERDLIYVDVGDHRPFVVFRASSVGGYGASDSVRSLFGQESDFALPKEFFAGIGRYLLLETLSTSASPIQLRVSVTRTPLGGADSQLRSIRIFGEGEAVEIAASGSGALDLVSPPVRPCVVQGRTFVLVDFGETQKMSKAAPYLYGLLKVEYSPDPRETTGFLRDISLAPSAPASSSDGEVEFDWSFGKFDANFEFSGLYEDGWISDRILLRPRRTCCGKLKLDFDVPAEEVAAGPATVSIRRGNIATIKQSLVAGRNTISVDFAKNEPNYVEISVDKPMTLPGGDQRRILGLLRHISLQ
jgi:hypothetical protein